jgi:tetratricopeptide (TPR) repeat protein
MLRNLVACKAFISTVAIVSICTSSLSVLSQDIVASDDITGGASVFVFRESRKKPQEKAGGRMFRSAGGRARAAGASAKYQAQLAANRKKRVTRATPNTATVAKNRTRARNPKTVQTAALVTKAETQLEANSVDEAIATYRQALNQDPKNTAAANGLSDALTAKAVAMSATDPNNSATIGLLEEAVTLDARNDVAFAKLGDAYDAANEDAKARASYEKAVQINPDLAVVYVPLGTSYLSAGEIAKAEAASRNAERLGVTDAEAQNLKGMILYRQNKNAEAMQVFDAVLKTQGRNATARYYQALVYDRMNQPDQSIAAFRDTVAADPSYSQAWFDLGVSYYNQENYKEAESAYLEAIKYDSANGQAHANLASTYRQQERYPEANAEYKLAEANGIKTPDLYSEWGYCLGKTAEWDKSVARLETARTISPTAIDDNNAGWGYYNAAQKDKAENNDAAANEKLAKGKESFESAVQKDPKLDAAYVNLGSTNNALGDFAAAVAALTIAVGIRESVIALNQLGVGYRGQGNMNSALTQFSRVVTLDGNNVIGLFNLGSAQYATGDKKGAKNTQARLKKLNPALADQLGSVIAGKVIDAGKQKIREKIRIPGIPF